MLPYKAARDLPNQPFYPAVSPVRREKQGGRATALDAAGKIADWDSESR